MHVLVFCLTFSVLIGPLADQGNTKSPQSPVHSWTNSLVMGFVSVPGTRVLFSVWDTRVQDYQYFANATFKDWRKPDFDQSPTHPAVNVSWYDAKAFCAWLTEKEHREGRIDGTQKYRLPTSEEWSCAVGFRSNENGQPIESEDVFPWGIQWPPPQGAGNYHQNLNIDDYKFTSPVGSFAANKFGLFDMGGNVWQWCEDQPDHSRVDRPQRGAAWADYDAEVLLSSKCPRNSPNTRNSVIGFRVVLSTDEPTL
jgi:formylglycine-generating enzyme required for sulfatase activity